MASRTIRLLLGHLDRLDAASLAALGDCLLWVQGSVTDVREASRLRVELTVDDGTGSLLVSAARDDPLVQRVRKGAYVRVVGRLHTRNEQVYVQAERVTELHDADHEAEWLATTIAMWVRHFSLTGAQRGQQEAAAAGALEA